MQIEYVQYAYTTSFTLTGKLLHIVLRRTHLHIYKHTNMYTVQLNVQTDIYHNSMLHIYSETQPSSHTPRLGGIKGNVTTTVIINAIIDIMEISTKGEGDVCVCVYGSCSISYVRRPTDRLDGHSMHTVCAEYNYRYAKTASRTTQPNRTHPHRLIFLIPLLTIIHDGCTL